MRAAAFVEPALLFRADGTIKRLDELDADTRLLGGRGAWIQRGKIKRK